MASHGFGIIGCGMIAEFHTRAIQEIPGARVAAVCDRKPAHGERVAKLAGDGCRVFTDVDAMLANPEVDVVSVCTPSGAHMEPAVRAAQAGKHVVVEKPMEITLPRCDAIIQACDAAGVRLCTIFPSRYSEANQALKAAIDTGRFGRLTLGDTHVKWWRTQEYYDSGGWRGTWELDGGGALMNQAIHNVDLIQWLMGDVESVHAMTATLAHLRIEVEDTAAAILRFKNGALGVIEAATGAYPGLLKRTEIHGDGGSARVEQDDITLWDFQVKAPSDAEVHAAMARTSGFSAGASDPRGINHIGHRDQLADFLQAIDSRGQPFVDGRQGRKAVEIIRAIYHSAETGETIRFPFGRPTQGDGPWWSEKGPSFRRLFEPYPKRRGQSDPHAPAASTEHRFPELPDRPRRRRPRADADRRAVLRLRALARPDPLPDRRPAPEGGDGEPPLRLRRPLHRGRARPDRPRRVRALQHDADGDPQHPPQAPPHHLAGDRITLVGPRGPSSTACSAAAL